MEDNAAVEIHDSTLDRVESHGDSLVAVFNAYVHRSFGRPGIDDGTGWSQELRLRVRNGKITGDIGLVPRVLLGGYLELSGEKFANWLPVPLDHDGPTRIELQSRSEWQVVILGEGLEARLTGAGEYIEEFRPSRDSAE
jgi:hypothetical protein